MTKDGHENYRRRFKRASNVTNAPRVTPEPIEPENSFRFHLVIRRLTFRVIDQRRKDSGSKGTGFRTFSPLSFIQQARASAPCSHRSVPHADRTDVRCNPDELIRCCPTFRTFLGFLQGSACTFAWLYEGCSLVTAECWFTAGSNLTRSAFKGEKQGMSQNRFNEKIKF